MERVPTAPTRRQRCRAGILSRARGAQLADCPFCKSPIDEHLAIHGGSCPSCFGEVPGEDAPTDPGAVVRAAQERQDAKTVARSRIPLMALLMSLIGVVVGAAYIITRPTPERAVLDLDKLDQVQDLLPHDVVAAPPVPEAVTPEPSTPARRPPSVVAVPGSDTPQTGGTRRPDLGEPDVAAVAPSRVVGGFDVGGMGGGMAPVRPRMQQEPMSDDSQIVEMVIEYMGQQWGTLTRCYEQQLRSQPDLRGEWVMEFVVTPAGDTSDVVVSGQGTNNPTMDSCLAEKLAAWKFHPIVAPQPIKRTARFRPR